MYLQQVNPHGGDAFEKDVSLDFSANINPCGTSRQVKAAMRRAVDLCGAYPDPYCRRLREAIAAYEGVPYAHILCGNGAAELIYAYSYALEDDRPVLIVSPTFCEYRAALDAAGKRAEAYWLTKQNDFALTEDILNAELSRYAAVFLCTPNNPTGLTVRPELLRAIAETGVRVFADMCFLELTETPDKYEIPELIADHPNVTVLKALTKSYAMAGVRLGYALCADEDFLERMSRKTQCWNVSVIAQEAGIAALQCKPWLKESVQLITAERERMAGVLRTCRIIVYPSEANFLLLYSEADLYNKLLERHILVRDCSDYTGPGKGFVRIAVRTREENDRLLAVIKEVTG